VVVEDSVHDEFVSRLTDRIKNLRVGDPLTDGTTMGPVISKGAMEGILNYIDIGKKKVRPSPRVVAGMATKAITSHQRSSSMPMKRCDCSGRNFRTVLSVLRFRTGDEDAAVRIANNSIFSLASAVWNRAHRSGASGVEPSAFRDGLGQHVRTTDARLPWGARWRVSIGRDLGLPPPSLYRARPLDAVRSRLKPGLILDRTGLVSHYPGGAALRIATTNDRIRQEESRMKVCIFGAGAIGATWACNRPGRRRRES